VKASATLPAPKDAKYIDDLATIGGAIKSQHLAKDYVGSDHGQYTHRIQWYCASVIKKHLSLKNQVLANTFKSPEECEDWCSTAPPEKASRFWTRISGARN
jgi:hypothetical protein